MIWLGATTVATVDVEVDKEGEGLEAGPNDWVTTKTDVEVLRGASVDEGEDDVVVLDNVGMDVLVDERDDEDEFVELAELAEFEPEAKAEEKVVA